MPNTAILAAAIGLPDNNLSEPAFAITEAGKMYLLLQAIVDRLHIEGSRASFEITPELADELAAFGSESEDLEDDDPAEEDGSLEENEQLESDCRFEAYKPTKMKPTRRIGRGKARVSESIEKESKPMSTTSFADQFLFDIGERVVVEVSGTIKVRQETEFGLKYIIQPDNPRAAAVHSSPEYVFPGDGGDEPPTGAEVAEIDDAVAA